MMDALAGEEELRAGGWVFEASIPSHSRVGESLWPVALTASQRATHEQEAPIGHPETPARRNRSVDWHISHIPRVSAGNVLIAKIMLLQSDGSNPTPSSRA